MKVCAVFVALVVLCAVPLGISAQQVISGDQFNRFMASSANYMNVPVVLEGTFENIEQNFNTIEIGNNLTSNMHVKFNIGPSPYPNIGMRTTPVMDGLDKVGPGDLVRVTGSLTTIQEKPKRYSIRGKYTTGPSYRERVHVYGPKESEIYFNVSKVEKGWGTGDSPAEMFKEGASLKEEHYRKVEPGASQLERDKQVDKLVDQAIWFDGTYEGLDENLTDLEKAAGITSDKVIKFKVKVGDDTEPCFIPYSESNLEGFKNLPVGTEIQVYGRIRKKETPKGWIAGFAADRVMKIVTREEAPPAEKKAAPAEKEEGGAAVLLLAPPPVP